MNIVKISDLTDEEKEKWKKKVVKSQTEQIVKENMEETANTLPRVTKIARQTTNALPTAKDIRSASPAELEAKNVPIVSNKDPRFKLATKKLSEYTTNDYYNSVEMNQVAMQKQGGKINELAKAHPVQAFGLNTIMNMAGGMSQSVFGINNAINTIGALGTKGLQKVGELTGNEELAKSAKDVYDKRIAEGSYINSAGNVIPGSNQYIENGVIKTAGQLSSTIGRQLMDAGIGGASGISGSTIQAIGVGGSSSQEVLDENPDNIVQAVLTGTLKGTVAKKLEDVFNANILTMGNTKNSVQNEITKWIANTFKTNTGKKIASYISDALGENVEEFLEDNIGTIVDKFVNGKDLPSFQEWLNNTGETAKITSLSTILMNLVGLGGETYNDVQQLSPISNVQQNQLNNQTNPQEQQITQTENNMSQNQNMKEIDNDLPIANKQNTYAAKEQLRIDSENFAKQVDAVENGTFPSEDMLTLGSTPKILQELGMKNLPITMTQKHLETISKKSGKYTNSNYHNLGIDTVKQLPEAIANPLNVLKSHNNSYVIITSLADKQGQIVIASIRIDGKGIVNNIQIDSNVLTSAYGRKNYDDYMKKNIEAGNLIYDIDEGIIKKNLNITNNPRLQLPNDISNSVPNNIISQSEQNMQVQDKIDKGIIKELPTSTKVQFLEGLNSKVTGARLQLPRRSSFSDSYESNINNSMPPTNKNVKSDTIINNSMRNSENNAQNTKKQKAPSIANNTLATGEYTVKQKEQIKSKNQYEQYNEYKKSILKRRADEVNNLISYKNQTTRNIDDKITEKQKLLNSKKNKDTKVANTLKTQIEKLKTQKTKIENLYNEKIDKVNAKTNKEKIDFETRNSMKKLARETLKEEISPLIEDMTVFKDKKAGWLYNRETAQRNIEDIVKDKEKANIINETIFNPIQKHQAEKTREINKLFSTINELKLDKSKRYEYFVKETNQTIKIDEATLAQLLIEKKISNDDLKNKYNMTDIQIAKINKTANTFSGMLDYLYDKMNEEQIKYGYSPIGKIKNYFPHFFENKPDTMLGKIASYFGIDVTKQNLPTEIAGITDTFKPGRTWNSNILQRKTDKTDYDALKSMERYIIGASDIIYTTEDIQKIRAFEREIRYKYSDKGIQEEIDKIWNDKELTQEAKDNAIEGIFKDKENELSNFVTWLNDYGNSLANKKAFSDRNMERNIGRNLYSSMSGIESRIASNTIGGNLSVSLTNFAPLFQAMGSTKVNYVLTGMLQTTQNNIKGIIGKKDVNFADNSTFLTNRFGTDTISKRTVSQNISDKASILMNTIDAFTSESIVRAKYLENLDSGMVEEQALNNADKYASRLMGDRSKGALPLVFNSKNPLSKLVTMFQVEPNNIVSNYLKDMPRNTQNKGELTWQASKLMVASYAFNTLVMAIRGGNEVLPDPIRWVSYLITAMTGDDEEREKAKEDLVESVIGSTAFVSNVAGLFGMEDIGRVPISNAMPDLSVIGKLTDKEADGEYKKEILMKELIKPFLYLGLPTGGAQIKKTVEGISTIVSGGSYKTDKDGNKTLQFPVENANIGDYIQGGVFGKYSLPTSKEYAERGYKSLNAKQTKMYEESKLSYSELTSYMDAELNKKEDKINYISQKNWNDNQKWTIYKYDIFSSDEREDGGSQLSDAEYITNNGVSKNEFIEIYNSLQKNNIDVPTESEYKEMKSSGISLKTYADYKINIKNKTQEKKNTNEITEKQSLKDTDKIQIILDSNYSNKEKTALYENYILSSQDETYPLIKQFFTNDGLNINKYLKYKTQGFESDKKDDGTVDGQSISGSKKKKVYDYVANMKISYTQRLLLLGTQYKLEQDQRNTLFNYINSSSLKNSEKLELLGKMEGFTVYKDGTVKW